MKFIGLIILGLELSSLMRKRKLYDDLTTNYMVSQVLLLGRTVFWIRTVFTKKYNISKNLSAGQFLRPDSFFENTCTQNHDIYPTT